MSRPPQAAQLSAVIFDWAGTTVDYGSFAPVQGFLDGFAAIGHPITVEMARAPMGLLKMDHARAIAQALPVALSEEEVRRAYESFEVELFANIGKHCDLKDHVREVVSDLRNRGMYIGSTTGYTSDMMAQVLPRAVAQGYRPDFWISPDLAAAGRPAPYMIWANMADAGIVDPRLVVKVGDTVADIAEGKAAGTWTVGIVMGSSELGLTRAEVEAIPAERLAELKAKVRSTYYRAGADYLIEDLSELPAVVDAINARLALNQPRLLLTPGPLTTRAGVKQAMLTDHCTWDGEYQQLTTQVMDEITAIGADDDYATVLLQGSGSYAVEAMIASLRAADSKTLFLVNGEYGRRMVRIAETAGIEHAALVCAETEPIAPAALADVLAADPTIGTVVLVHCETTTGLLNPLADLCAVAKAAGKRLLVDAMSSFAAYDIDLPALGIDALAASSNKCLEGLPGLGFVIARRDLLADAAGMAHSHSLDLHDQHVGLQCGKFRFTSPTNILLALAEAIRLFRLEGGVSARGARYAENHRLLVEGLAALGVAPIIAAEQQSHIITTFALERADGSCIDFDSLYAHLKAQGFIIYPGKLTRRPTFRIGSIGNVFPADMRALVAAIGEALDGPAEDVATDSRQPANVGW